MHFTFHDLTVEIVICLFMALIIGYVFLMLVDILWKIDYSKAFGCWSYLYKNNSNIGDCFISYLSDMDKPNYNNNFANAVKLAKVSRLIIRM